MHFHFNRKLILLLKIRIEIAYPEKQIFSQNLSVWSQRHIYKYFVVNLSCHILLSSLQKICIYLCLRRNYGAEVRHLTRLRLVFQSCLSWLVILGITLCLSVTVHVGMKKPLCLLFVALI